MISKGQLFLLAMFLTALFASPADAQLTVGVAGDTLMILGTSSNDDVRVWDKNNGDIAVRGNGQTTQFSSAGITQILFEGFAGNDRFRADVDILSIANGGSGNDRLLTVSGPAEFEGEAGDDTLIGGPDDDLLGGGSGDDYLYGNGDGDFIFGDAGVDIVYGGNGDDVIDGGTQDDLIFGQGGDDVITGDNGSDSLFGGSGADEIDGGRGPDKLYGSSGDDMLNGSNGKDKLYGGSGDDVICGGDADDKLYGSSGDDELFGESGMDLLNGGAGANTLDQDSPGPCSGNVIGGVSDVCTQVAFPRAQTNDNNGNGIVDPGDGFELDVVFSAGPTGATGVSFGQNFSVIGPGAQVGGVGEVVGDLAPNEVVITDPSSDACIAVDGAASPGDQIFVEFDVTADGETERFRAGPFVLGQIQDGQTICASPVVVPNF